MCKLMFSDQLEEVFSYYLSDYFFCLFLSSSQTPGIHMLVLMTLNGVIDFSGSANISLLCFLSVLWIRQFPLFYLQVF